MQILPGRLCGNGDQKNEGQKIGSYSLFHYQWVFFLKISKNGLWFYEKKKIMKNEKWMNLPLEFFDFHGTFSYGDYAFGSSDCTMWTTRRAKSRRKKGKENP